MFCLLVTNTICFVYFTEATQQSLDIEVQTRFQPLFFAMPFCVFLCSETKENSEHAGLK